MRAIPLILLAFSAAAACAQPSPGAREYLVLSPFTLHAAHTVSPQAKELEASVREWMDGVIKANAWAAAEWSQGTLGFSSTGRTIFAAQPDRVGKVGGPIWRKDADIPNTVTIWKQNGDHWERSEFDPGGRPLLRDPCDNYLLVLNDEHCPAAVIDLMHDNARIALPANLDRAFISNSGRIIAYSGDAAAGADPVLAGEIVSGVYKPITIVRDKPDGGFGEPEWMLSVSWLKNDRFAAMVWGPIVDFEKKTMTKARKEPAYGNAAIWDDRLVIGQGGQREILRVSDDGTWSPETKTWEVKSTDRYVGSSPLGQYVMVRKKATLGDLLGSNSVGPLKVRRIRRLGDTRIDVPRLDPTIDRSSDYLGWVVVSEP